MTVTSRLHRQKDKARQRKTEEKVERRPVVTPRYESGGEAQALVRPAHQCKPVWGKIDIVGEEGGQGQPCFPSPAPALPPDRQRPVRVTQDVRVRAARPAVRVDARRLQANLPAWMGRDAPAVGIPPRDTKPAVMCTRRATESRQTLSLLCLWNIAL